MPSAWPKAEGLDPGRFVQGLGLTVLVLALALAMVLVNMDWGAADNYRFEEGQKARQGKTWNRR